MSNRTSGQAIDLQMVRNRVEQTLISAFLSKDASIIDALPASGKTYSTFKAATVTNTSILYLAPRRDLYDQAAKYCKKFNLAHKCLPSPHSDCPSFRGDHGNRLKNELEYQYAGGLSGVELHNFRSLPCQDNDSCPYMQAVNFDPDDYDVLIGNPKHAYNEDYLRERVVVKDEFSETEYETCFDDVDALVSNFVKNVGLPFTDYQNVLSVREGLSDATLGNIEDWFDTYGLYRDRTGVLTGRGDQYHVLAPALTYAVLHSYMGQLNNGWEYADMGFLASQYSLDTQGFSDEARFVRNQQRDVAYLLRPPDFTTADGFVGLDGTPTPQMWELATGLDLDHRQVLLDAEKAQYISTVLNHTIVQTNNSTKPYQNARNVTPPKDTQLAFWIQLNEENRPNVITSKKALDDVYPDYRSGEFFSYVDQTMNFANVHSSNAFADDHLGLVIGSRHYGDEYIKRWGAYQGEGITANGCRGLQRSYGAVGDAILSHLHNQTLQDVLRFGRDQQPTTVYVNTSTLPSWVPVIKKQHLPRFSQNRRNVIQVLKQKGSAGASVKEIANADETDLSKAGARKAAEYLVHEGLAEKQEFEGYSNVYIWNGLP